MRRGEAREALRERFHPGPLHRRSRSHPLRARRDQAQVRLLRLPRHRERQAGRPPHRHRHDARPRLCQGPLEEGCRRHDDRRRLRTRGLHPRGGQPDPARLEEGQAARRQRAQRARRCHLAQGPAQEPRLPARDQGRAEATDRRRVRAHAPRRQGARRQAGRGRRRHPRHRLVAGRLHFPEGHALLHQDDLPARRGRRRQRRHRAAGQEPDRVGRRRAAHRDGLGLHLHDAGGDGGGAAAGDGRLPRLQVRAPARRAVLGRRRHLQHWQD
mmetsp:Transcript_24960/g.66961  ORF Transcript_24960/g.66961 Transcript_24960/m.66961 type:complete len:270 (-) Transcript_24960:856-1665(-)